MTDFAQARRMMVEGQIRTNDVTDLDLLAAFDEVPRERFVPERWQPIAYLDRDVPIQETGGRCLLKPLVLAKLIRAAEVEEGDRGRDVVSPPRPRPPSSTSAARMRSRRGTGCSMWVAPPATPRRS